MKEFRKIDSNEVMYLEDYTTLKLYIIKKVLTYYRYSQSLLHDKLSHRAVRNYNCAVLRSNYFTSINIDPTIYLLVCFNYCDEGSFGDIKYLYNKIVFNSLGEVKSFILNSAGMVGVFHKNLYSSMTKFSCHYFTIRPVTETI